MTCRIPRTRREEGSCKGRDRHVFPLRRSLRGFDPPSRTYDFSVVTCYPSRPVEVEAKGGIFSLCFGCSSSFFWGVGKLVCTRTINEFNPTHTNRTKYSASEASSAKMCVHLSVCDDGFYFVRPHCFLSLSTSSRYRGSALALAKRGEYIIVEGVIAWASRALFMYSKKESRSPRAW